MFVKVYFNEVMKLKKQIIPLLLILVIGSSDYDLYSQNIPAKPSRQSSLEAFSKGNYEQAYKEFKELLLTYSKDPLYKYYSGVCLINLNREPGEAESLLKQALQSASVVKSLPSDALFFLGRAQQMGGKFNEAIISYNQFSDQVGKKASKELNVQSFVQQCNENKGKVVAVEASSAENIKIEKPVLTEPAPVLKESRVEPVVKDSFVNRNIPSGVDQILNDALELQIKADSVTALVAEQKNQLESVAVGDRNGLKGKIGETELAAASFQKAADLKYNEARALMNPRPEKNNQLAASKQPVIAEDTVIKSDYKVTSSTFKQPVNQKGKVTSVQTDTDKNIEPEFNSSIEVFKIFEILPKPVKDPAEKIKIDPEVPEGLIYRIQIAVFRNPVAPSYFKGITPIYGFKVAGTDKTGYFAGMFRRASDAAKALASVKAKGFKDAFVIAQMLNKPVSSDRAAVLEKEWGKKSFFNIMKVEQKTPADTITPALLFRVEVTRSLKPIKIDMVEEIKKMAGSRGLDIQTLDDGNIAYLIGKFITFDTASEYASLLIKNGYGEARVVAWLGKKEIAVETARQLFDNLK